MSIQRPGPARLPRSSCSWDTTSTFPAHQLRNSQLLARIAVAFELENYGILGAAHGGPNSGASNGGAHKARDSCDITGCCLRLAGANCGKQTRLHMRHDATFADRCDTTLASRRRPWCTARRNCALGCLRIGSVVESTLTANPTPPRNDSSNMAATLKIRSFQLSDGFDLDAAAADGKIRDFPSAHQVCWTGPTDHFALRLRARRRQVTYR